MEPASSASTAVSSSLARASNDATSATTTNNVVVTNGAPALDQNSHSHAPIINNTPSHSKISSGNLKKSAYPIIKEREFGNSIKTRTTQLPNFKDLGPADLVHISTINNRSKNHAKEHGQYHFISGLDVSSVDAPIAYLSSVLLNFENSNSSAKSLKKDLQIGTFCSYNCFTKGDLRIRAEFPGSITTTFIFADPKRVALSGDRITEQIWLETQVSAIIRSLLFSEDLNRIAPGMVRLNPLSSKKLCMEFIDKMTVMLSKGPLTGSRNTVLTPSYQNNYLNDALMKLVELTFLYDYAIEKIRDLAQDENSNFQLLIIKILFLLDKEVDAVRILHDEIKKNTRDAFLLIEQSNYLISKGRPDLALKSSQQLLYSSPTEFETWQNLVEVNMILENYKELLSILNSAPMYSVSGRDAVTVNMNDEFIMEEPFEGCIDEVWEDSINVFGKMTPLDVLPPLELQQCDPVLIRLFNNSRLHGTFAKLYELIANLVRLIGWDRILQLRSEIFVMEEEISSSKDAMALRNKVLCERWLDHLFLILYDDLRVVMIWENDRIDNVVRHSALEWLLIGLLSLRCHHFESGILALKTTINSKFNFFASQKLIQVYRDSQTVKFKLLHNKTVYNTDIITTKLVNDEYLIKLIVKHLSYEKRYYGEFDPDLVLMISNFIRFQYNEIYLKSLIAGQFNKSLRLFVFTDRIIDWIMMCSKNMN